MFKLMLLPLLALTAHAQPSAESRRLDYALALVEANGGPLYGICDLAGLARDGATIDVVTEGAQVTLVGRWEASPDVAKELRLQLDSSYRQIQRGEITTTVFADRFVNEGDLAHPRVVHRRAGRSMTTSCL